VSFFATKNLVTLSLEPCEPWTFKPTEALTAQIRNVKEDRQNFYQNPATQHCFYTGIEAHAPNQRTSKENPPRTIHAFPADYDIKIPRERIMEVVNSMAVKPTYLETSLGGNFRLVWVLEQPIQVESREFCTFVLQQAHDWLRLDLLPGLDRKAWEETSRLYCNGCEWEKIGEVVPAKASQAFFVSAGQKYRFPAADDAAVPLDLVEKALREKYPNFNWPGPFELDTQGPSFWIAASVSTQSAIVKPGGMFTFAAHAGKPFYSWGDLIGADFVKKFQDDAIARATNDLWWDGKQFWKRKGGIYVSHEGKEIDSYLRVTCRLSKKPGQNGISPFDSALEHVYQHQSVVSAGPFVFVRPGLITHEGFRKLNTWMGKPMEPAVGTQVWGPLGNFPFISAWLDQFFSTLVQLDHWRAWHKHFYTGAVNYQPLPGPNFALSGFPGCGKTLLNRSVVGVSVGGYADASNFLVDGCSFNSELYDKGMWVLDDDTPSTNQKAQNRLASWLKKMAANQQHMVNGKFLKSCMVDFSGRIGCTTNVDFMSMRAIGPMDNNSMDKMMLLRCNPNPGFVFPSRKEIVQYLENELKFYLRFLLDWEPPEHCIRDNRYGYVAHHEQIILDQVHQTSPSATFKELLIAFLDRWFEGNPKEPFWEGTVSGLLAGIISTDCNEYIVRHMRLESVSRYLEQVQREGAFKVEVHQGRHNTRLWRFHRD
jgi:hypothetical protein